MGDSQESIEDMLAGDLLRLAASKGIPVGDLLREFGLSEDLDESHV